MDDLKQLARSGTEFKVRVTPKAARNLIKLEPGLIRVYVTTVPENGKATAAVIKLLAKAIGVPKSSIELLRGAKAREKVFKVRK